MSQFKCFVIDITVFISVVNRSLGHMCSGYMFTVR